MKLARLSIRRKVTFSMIFLVIIFFGLFGLSQLNVDFYPDIKFPMVLIITQYEGVGANDIEEIITKPIEKSVASVENIKKLSSTSTQGSSVINLEFEWGTDLDQAEIDVRKYIDMVGDALPDDVDDPLVFVFDPSMMPVVFLNMYSHTMGPGELRKFSEDYIEPFFERTNGVASAETMGGLSRSVQVRVNPLKLAQYHTDINAVTTAIRRENLRLPSGSINDGTIHYDLKTSADYTRLDEIENVLVCTVGGKSVFVKDVATVEDSYHDMYGNVRSNGNPGMMLTISKQSDANTVKVCGDVIGKLDELKEIYGDRVEFALFFNQAEFINKSLSNLSNTAVQAIIFTFLILLIFLLHLRSSFIVAVTIPVSIVATFFVMYFAGVTLNVISLAGLALAIGMLVDNAIVVLENIFRHRKLGEDIMCAADKGSTEVGMAITASTLTTLAVFIPILFVPGIAGMLFNDMVLTICFSLVVSLFTALSLIPLLASSFLSDESMESHANLKAFPAKIDSALDKLSDSYGEFLAKVIRHRKLTISIMLAVFIFSLPMFGLIGMEFTPKEDRSFIALNIKKSVGTDYRKTEETVKELEKFVKENIPEAITIYMNYGSSGNAFAAMRGAGSYTIQMRLKLLDMGERERSQARIEEVLREKLNTMADLTYEVEQQGGFSTEPGDISLKIHGDNLDTLKTLSKKFQLAMETVAGVRDVQNSFTEPAFELNIKLDREKIAHYGLSVNQVMNMIYRSFQGETASRFRDEGDEYDIFVRLDPAFRKNRYDLEKLFIKTPLGNYIPLEEVAEINLERTPVQILRESQERMARVYCTVHDRDLKSTTDDIVNKLKEIDMPMGYRYEVGGASADMQESMGFLVLALLGSALLVYMVMASQFESLVDPFIIFFSIPLSIVGVIWILFITNTNLSVIAMVGLIMLAGIVVNNGIVLIDTINQLYHTGEMPLFEAVVEAGKRRLKPILMTALTTICSMIPLAMELGEGAESWSPLARTVIGGLVFSTFVTLLYAPALYVTLEMKGFRKKKKDAPACSVADK